MEKEEAPYSGLIVEVYQGMKRWEASRLMRRVSISYCFWLASIP